jgi:hypothetical protein
MMSARGGPASKGPVSLARSEGLEPQSSDPQEGARCPLGPSGSGHVLGRCSRLVGAYQVLSSGLAAVLAAVRFMRRRLPDQQRIGTQHSVAISLWSS